MVTEFGHTLRRLRGAVVGWSVGVALYGLLMAFFYPTAADMEEVFEEYIGMFPETMIAFFDNLHAIATPMGFMDVYFFSYLHLIIGILAISAGTAMLAGDEERGVLDLVLAQPVSRSCLFWGRLLGILASLVIVLAAGWLSWALPADTVGLDLTPLQLLLPFLPLFAVLALFTGLAVLFSMLLPSARIAGMLTGGLMVANYLLLGLSKINDSLEPVMELTPLRYYQAGSAIEGLKVDWLVGLLAATLIAACGGWLSFLRRDIRVSGERSWGLPDIRLPSLRRGSR